MSRAVKATDKRSQLRIIGGQWRGRKLVFTPIDGLRPTTDRVRETLFNWLAADIHGARCLDLFAGSGALGLEALSRGAAHCDFVDTSSIALGQLQSHLETLDAQQKGKCHRGSALQYLKFGGGPWDIVFLDPPFDSGLVSPACELLASTDRLTVGALVYVETGSKEEPPEVPGHWAPHREKRAGGVCYRLFIVGPG